jgi:hypothetical protein
MKTLRYIATALVAGATLASLHAAAKVAADLAPSQKRQATVETAERLAQRKAPAPLPGDLASPFNPPDFDKADPSDPANLATRPGASGAGPSTPTAPAAPVAPPTARETLETLAAQITPSGMIQLRGTPRLIIGNKPFEVGTRFTATYNNQDYDLELVAIDRTTFTLRYRSEEITRPIKPVR